MSMKQFLARVVSGLKQSMSPPKGARPRKMCNGAWWAYWPVILGSSLAIVLVAAGLTVAVQTVKRPANRWAEVQSPPDEIPIIEIKVRPGTARPEPPPQLLALKEPLPGPIPTPKLQEMGLLLQPPAAEILVDDSPPDAQTCDTYGTSVNFMRSPAAAARRAGKEDKLLFTLHVSGNFEDPQFT